MRNLSALLLVITICTTLFANGPAKIASIDRSVVPIKITDRKSFNEVSRLEILFFVNEVASVSQWKEKSRFQQFLSREKINLASINSWIETTQEKLLSLYNASSADQPFTRWDEKRIPQHLSSWQELTGVAQSTTATLPEEFSAWHTKAKAFYKTYLYEQIRLAALFPAITSEIHCLDSSESQGFEYNDGEFLLTFDDGPTPKGGNTDKIIQQLNQWGISGTFFVLGEKLQKRINTGGIKEVQTLYRDHHLESHGMVHKAHPRYEQWKESLDATRRSISSIQESTETTYFRPPYGQRSPAQVEYLKSRNEQVMLWNIDSQDWNSKLSTKDMENRVITLMLLWRSGILLFHDIHPKTLKGLPGITAFAKRAQLTWKESNN